MIARRRWWSPSPCHSCIALRACGSVPYHGVTVGISIAPAFVLGQMCDFIDLDGPTFLSSDRDTPATYTNGQIWCPDDLWGAPTQPSLSEVPR